MRPTTPSETSPNRSAWSRKRPNRAPSSGRRPGERRHRTTSTTWPGAKLETSHAFVNWSSTTIVPASPRKIAQCALRPARVVAASSATVSPAYAPTGCRRNPMTTGPASSSTVERYGASVGGSPLSRSPSVSAAISSRWPATSRGTRPIHRSIRSSRASPASRRRSWMARWSSRASPSATSSGVSSVSMTTTRPWSWATAVPASAMPGSRPRRARA